MTHKYRSFLAGSALAALLLAAPFPAQAASRRLGLGLIVGSPTGLSGKQWLDEVHAVDFAIGTYGYYLGSSYGGFDLHVDYLWHHYGVFGEPGSAVSRRLPIYLGLGGAFASPGVAGVRGVIGLTYLFDEPFDVFFELAPTLVLAPFSGFGTSAGLGGRFYF